MYVDPQAGSILFQVIVAAVLGTAFTFKRWWAQVAAAFGALRTRFSRR